MYSGNEPARNVRSSPEEGPSAAARMTATKRLLDSLSSTRTQASSTPSWRETQASISPISMRKPRSFT